MCSERDFAWAARERPVDRPGICCCSVPESIRVVLNKGQILSFDDFITVGSGCVDKEKMDGPTCDSGAA